MAYTRGNLAVKEQSAEKAARRYRETTKVVLRRSALPTKEKLLYLMTIIFCATVASVIVFQYAHIYEVNKNIQSMDSETASIKKQTTQNEIRKYSLQDQIVERATALGYIEPTDTAPIQVSRVKGTEATTSTTDETQGK
ncbi:hypothetical protein QCD85_20650 [Paenibacillus sp. PsM32]|uniref:Cell division protein FtsL n=1 Tax=Paenibacillus kyungheensis TaxID=1452732 RepID=A0AAX3LYS3_9BACL|nr:MULTISPECIES: hypothetical protein [Paenibacillus]MDN4620539.1 hypothetical protein [Paenibacillus sp. PsM32]MDQ1235012.1 cell division protein FtsL [Paenibacillus sp. SORGH_AS_0306]MDR6112060.1 cell division protein FtsL [Paenibacillus sp. SORGH_AS_0338]WCT54584.1 hypothetical protein PQ456_15440 [Paenibacillus kyungheensis]WDF52272.1 hypothetical protein PQ460_07615 [Paenibacillus sp. KACC 21273]